MNEFDTFDYPLDHIQVKETYKEFDPHDSIIDELNTLYLKNHNCTVNGLIWDNGMFYIFLDGDITWNEKVEQVELFNLKYPLLGNHSDDWIIINENGQLVESTATNLMLNTFKWSPITALTKRLIWDWLNDYLKTTNSIYRISNIFLNKQEGNCKVIVKNLKQDIE